MNRWSESSCANLYGRMHDKGPDHMRESQGDRPPRQAAAIRAAQSPAAMEVMTIQCSRSHHLARVVSTPEGDVIETLLAHHSHGRRDLHSDTHGVDHPNRWRDLLEAGDEGEAIEMIPVGCACGERRLSRADVIDWRRSGDSRIILE